jgi:hypothetical protein
MSQLYDIYFSAQLIDDFDEATVRKNIAQLFKANETALEKLFSGKPQLIKGAVDKAAAIKYKAAMQKAGAVARIREHPQKSTAAPKPAAKPAPTPATGTPLEDELPSSSDITPESAAAKPAAEKEAARAAALAKQPAAVTFGDEISLAPPGSNVLQEDEREQQEAVEVDTSHLSMGEVGEDIPHIESTEENVNPDISHLSMGEVGEDIPNLEKDDEILNPDTSGIELSPEGSDMLEEKDRKKETGEAPNTDHLSLKD